jgi:hypothetical protein
MNNKVLYQPWGGLGDNLQYSTLPELYHKLGYEFYISKDNVYRNDEIYDLVWGLNPYVKGISDEPFNVGSCVGFSRVSPNESIIYNQEICHGFEPQNRIPKIYYEPKNIIEFNDKIILDISSVSTNPVVPKNLDDFIKINFPNKTVVIPKFKNKISDNHKINRDIELYEYVEIDSIFHYTDIINSCHQFICSFSGQSVLASAINKKNTICFIPENYITNSYVFHNIKYFQVKNV